ncbi:MAG: hypothetical protein EAZ15_08190 [Sphingobacteriales bacterium]|nr:MAG: hypothetical protein EAZ15_08190 [Sphingobacteriales bacterium]
MNIIKKLIGDSPTLIAQVLQLTIKQLNQSSQQLEKIIEQEDIAALNTLGHKLHGTAVTAGLHNLAIITRSLEAKTNFDLACIQLINNAKDEIEIALNQISLALETQINL